MQTRTIRAVLGAAIIGACGLVASLESTVAQGPPEPTSGELLTDGFAFSLGAAIGPDGAVYVADAGIGAVVRVDPADGTQTVVAEGLPASEEGGVTDIVFLDDELYIATTLTEPDAPSGVHRVEDDDSLTLIADTGQYAMDNPVDFEDAIPTGNLFAIDLLGDGFVVSEANHNKILQIGLDGEITELGAFGNIVPTGLATNGTFYFSTIGPFPHTPETGAVYSLDTESGDETLVASGVPYVIDVEYGPGGELYALSFGNEPPDEEAPAEPFTGKLLLVNDDGTFSTLVENLMLPTSLNFIDDTAYILTLTGELWAVEGVSDLQPIVEPTPTPTTPAPSTPTATATSPATATATPTATMEAPAPPDTGTGTTGGDSRLILVLAALAAVATAGAVLRVGFARTR